MITPPRSLELTIPDTPIIEITAKKGTQLWLKRDDITGIELSGNKIRKLDFLIQEAIDRKSKGIITCGGLQSNHCRAAAYAAVSFLYNLKKTRPTTTNSVNKAFLRRVITRSDSSGYFF